MKKAFLILSLFLLLFLPQEGFAKLNAPNPLPVSSIGERSARLEWTWSAGGGTITDFEVDIARKGGVADCRDIESWGVPNLAGASERRFNARGLERGETYCWKIMARADNPANNSEFAYGPQFTTEVGARGAVCGANGCEAGEDPISCPQDCGRPGAGDDGREFTPGNLNPISSATLGELLNNVLNFLFGLSIVVLPIIILYGGFLLLTAGGSPEKISKARTILLWAVIAFAIILLARGLPAILRGLL